MDLGILLPNQSGVASARKASCAKPHLRASLARHVAGSRDWQPRVGTCTGHLCRMTQPACDPASVGLDGVTTTRISVYDYGVDGL